jgi:hypothetical protein
MTAILASRVIAQKYVFPRERPPFKRYVNVFGKTNNRRGMDGEFLRMEYVAVVLLHSRHSFKDHHHCAPFRAHVDGLKRSI